MRITRKPTARRVALGITGAGGLLALGATVAVAATSFSDVPPGSTHENGINYVAGAGITQGCTPTTYCPSAPVRRDQMATFFYRASGNDPATAPTVNVDKVDGRDASSLLAAAVHVTRDGSDAPVVQRFVNNVNGTAPSITTDEPGLYDINMGFLVSSRFPQCSVDTNFADTRDASCTVNTRIGNTVRVRIHDASVGGGAAAEFWVTVSG